MDFIATNSLTNIYLYSVKETIAKLEQLSQLPVDYSLNKEEQESESEPGSTSRTGKTDTSGKPKKISIQAQPFL